MLRIVAQQTEQELLEHKRLDESAPFECAECGYRAFIALRAMEAHAEKCKGRKPIVSKKKKPSAPLSSKN